MFYYSYKLKMMRNIKNIAKKILPKTISNILRKKFSLVDLSLVELIKEKDLEFLSHPKKLELELLPKLGLNDESLRQFPEELYDFCGDGLLHWQYPNQFSKYLVQLSKFKIETYLEIGVHHGGTFIITVEYLEKFHPLKNAIGVDIGRSISLSRYKKINPKISFMQIDSQSSRFKGFIRNCSGFDLVLIDGSHEYAACRNDFETVKDKAKIVVFHDMTSDAFPGVGQVWNQVKDMYSDVYKFFEYTDQYKSVSLRTGQNFLGIGMAVRKEYLQKNIFLCSENLDKNRKT